MKLAFFDTKPYDKPGFDEHIAGTDIEIKYFETRLGEDTVQLAKGFDGVCVFVNDTVNAKVAGELYDLGVRVIALRCAGFNNVDTKACFGKLHVFRVPAYSPPCGGGARDGAAADRQPAHKQGVYPHARLQFQPVRADGL